MDDKSLAYQLLSKFESDRNKIERYSALAERCPLPAFVTGSDGFTILYINPAYVQLTGRTLEELQNGSWTIVIHPADREAVEAAWRIFTLQKVFTPHWHRYIHKDGRVTEAMTLVDRVENNGFVGFILPQCGSKSCPVRLLNNSTWNMWEAFQAKHGLAG